MVVGQLTTIAGVAIWSANRRSVVFYIEHSTCSDALLGGLSKCSAREGLVFVSGA